MKHEIPVYAKEREAGLTEIIRAKSSVAYITRLEPVEATSLPREFHKAQAEEDQFDLYYMRDVLASTGWNKNADVFDRIEMWMARHTPEDKPFNFEHDDNDIIGHITASHLVDDSFAVIPEDTAPDDLPDKFHIVSGSVIYRMRHDDDKSKLIEQTIAEIKAGEWFVSMECLFSNFDYAVIDSDGTHRVIARDSESAFLTKHLRQYGGDGKYTDKATGSEFTLGRLFRNFTFSGKGLVRKPANEDSIILTKASTFVPLAAPINIAAGETDMAESNAEVKVLETQLDALRKQNESLAKSNEDLAKSLKELDGKAVATKVATLESEIKNRDDAITNLNTQLEAVKASLKEVGEKLTAAEAAHKTVSDELAVSKASELKRSRTATLLAKNATAEAAEQLVNKFANFTDEQFNETVEILAPAWKPVPAGEKEEAVASTKKPEEVLDDAAKNKKAEASVGSPDGDAPAEDRLKATASFIGNFLKNKTDK